MSSHPSTATQPDLSPPPTTTHPLPTPSSFPRTLHIGTRSSALALAQVHLFTTLLSTHDPSLQTTTHPSHTNLGDINKTTSLHTLASTGKSLWTEDLETQLENRETDIIVHSMKDVPTQLRRGLCVAAVGAREESRDAVVMSCFRVGEGKKGLGDLPRDAVVGTSSVRRAAMIRRRWPHLRIKDVRGNVGTRIRKLDSPEEGFDALVLAGAGVQRLGMGERVSSWLGRREGVMHSVGQGALGVEWREGDGWVEGLLERVGRGKVDRRVRWEVVAERGVLRALEGGCSVPVGVDCTWRDGDASSLVDREQDSGSGDSPPKQHIPDDNNAHSTNDSLPTSPSPLPTAQTSLSPTNPPHSSSGGILSMHAMVVSVDGQQCVEGYQEYYIDSDASAEEFALRVYKELVDKGAENILKDIRLNRGMIEGELGGA